MAIYMRREWWKPWANTIWYRPLNSTTRYSDMSWNNNSMKMNSSTPPEVTFTEKWAIFGSTYYWQQLETTNNCINKTESRTIAFWRCKDTNWYGWTELDLETPQGYYWWVMSYNTKLAIYKNGTNEYWSTDVINNTQSWYHIVYTTDTINKVMKLYVNWELYMQTSYGSYLGQDDIIFFKWRLWMWISCVIVEKWVWDAQKVQNYYQNNVLP